MVYCISLMSIVAIIFLCLGLYVVLILLYIFLDDFILYLVNRIFDCCYSKKKKNTIIVPKEIISEYIIVINPRNHVSIGKEYNKKEINI